MTAWPSRAPADILLLMTYGDPGAMATRVLLSAPEIDELVRELEALRAAHQAELAERLSDARASGSAGDDDDRLAVLEDAAVDGARITQLEQLLRCASVVDAAPTADDGAGLGSVVRVRDVPTGRTAEYELVGRRGAGAGDGQVSLGSPVGEALIGVRPEDVVRVELPHGRARTLRVLGVRTRTVDPGTTPA